jgi:hypothetical protein
MGFLQVKQKRSGADMVRLLGIGFLWIVGSLLTVAQDSCKPLSPTLCPSFNQDPHDTEGQDACEKKINAEYFDFLQKAEDHKPSFDLDVPSFGHRGRCPEDNDDRDEKKDTDNKNRFVSLHDLFLERLEANANSEPLPVEQRKIYLDENQRNYYGCFVHNEGTKLINLARMVGRLELRDDTHHLSPVRSDCKDSNCLGYGESKSNKSILYSQWGTAIKIANSPYLAITSCHVLEPLVKYDSVSGEWYLKLDQDENLMVDFGRRDDQFDYGKEFKVKQKIFWMPANSDDYKGFDVAVLELLPRESVKNIQDQDDDDMENMDGIRWGSRLSKREEIEVAAIGYPDFHHPLDPCAEAAFAHYKTQGDARFVALGCARKVSTIGECREDIRGSKGQSALIFHSATTTAGESGSMLVARDLNNPSIIGIHVCCSYPQENTYSRPESKLKCAQLDRTDRNQAIDICTLYNDKTFRAALKARGIDKLGGNWNCPTSPATK